MVMRKKKYFVSILIFIFFGALLVGTARAQESSRVVPSKKELMPVEKNVIEIFRNSKDSVVYITTLVYRQDAFSFNVLAIPRGTGTGFVWDKDGHIVTNYHVILGAENVKVTLSDHSEWEAVLVGVAPHKDLAVLKIKAPRKKMHPIVVGNSQHLEVGQSVLAIGNPFGLDQTLTTGIISALGREIESVTHRPIQGVIQTDAAINPGNSGGPLLDSAGRCIGVNTAIYSPSGVYAGIGFAVPVSSVKRIVPQLIEHGKLIRPGFGIKLADDYLARQMDITGVLVLNVQPHSAAARAGMQPTQRDAYGHLILGDIIVGLDEKNIKSSHDLFTALDHYKVGDRVKVGVIRARRKKELRVTLQAL